MGDRLEDENWVAAEQEEVEGASLAADWVEEDDSQAVGSDGDEDEVETIAEWREQENRERKHEKKQAKFAALKEKKKQLRDAEIAAGEEDDAPQSSPEQMLQDLCQNAPVPYRTYQQLQQAPFFEAGDFFYPALDTSTTESTTKARCPFVRALSAGLPHYKRLLLSPDAAAQRERKGSPVMVILASSAIRATEIIRSVSAKLIKVKIAKLFAKHFKISEQIEMLSKEYYPVVIGTPNRVEKLIELGALSLKDTQVLLVDHTPDSKQFTILTLPEVKNDMYKLLYEYVHPERSHIKIALVKAAEIKKKDATANKKPTSHQQHKRKYGKHDNSQRQGFKSEKAQTQDDGDRSNKKQKTTD